MTVRTSRTFSLLIAALLTGLPLSDAPAQATRTFLGGSPIDPNGWIVQANWENFNFPQAGENVIISQGAFARFNIGATFNNLALGSSPAGTTRLEISAGSRMALTNGGNINNGRLDIQDRLSISEDALFVAGQGSIVTVQSSTTDPARLSLEPRSTMLLEGRLSAFENSRLFLDEFSSLQVGGTGELRIERGEIRSIPGSQVQVADGGSIFMSGMVSIAFSGRLDGANARLTIENTPSLQTGGLFDRMNVHSDVGGQVIYRGQGSIVGANLTGSNVRVSIDRETTVRQFLSTAGATFTLEDLSQLIFTPSSSGDYTNSLGGALAVNGTATLGYDTNFGAANFTSVMATIDLTNGLNLAAGSQLQFERRGADAALNNHYLDLNFNTFSTWTIGANSTLVANSFTRLTGIGLSSLANANLTTRLEGNAILDLSSSLGSRAVNSLNSSSADSLITAGIHQITLNGGDFAGQISTTGGLNIGGDVILRAAQSYSGGTTISGSGNLSLIGPATLGSGDVTVNGTLDFAQAHALAITLANLSGSGAILHGNRTLTFTNSTAGIRTVGQTFTGDGDLIKAGSGTTRFTGSMAGNGPLRIHAGTLLIDSALTRPVSVLAGATLGGSGTMGAVDLASGAFLSPGNSTGTLTTGAMSWLGGANLVWEINDATGSEGGSLGWDLLSLTGVLTLNSTNADRFIFQIHSLTAGNTPGIAVGFVENQLYSFVVARASGGITGFSPDIFHLDTANFSDGLAGPGSFWLEQNGNDLVLRYQTIPEPSSVVLLISAALFIFLRRVPWFSNGGGILRGGDGRANGGSGCRRMG
jgi:hypothetical protein